MSYKGTGPPGFIWNETIHVLPQPKRELPDDYKELTEEKENILGEILRGEPTWRYLNEYEFPNLDQDIVDTLLNVVNDGRPVVWIPHTDFDLIKYPVHLKAAIKPGKVVYIDAGKISVKGVNVIHKKPSIDNMITAIDPMMMARVET